MEEDAEYEVIVVDSLTTATEDQYTIKNPVFRKGRSSDSLSVVVHKTPALKDKSVHLTLRLVENENFGLGYMAIRMYVFVLMICQRNRLGGRKRWNWHF